MSNQPQKENSKDQNQPPSHKHHHKHGSNLPFNPSFFGAILGIFMLSALFIYEFFIVSQPSYWVPCLIIFLFFLCMVYWSYFSTVCNDPGRVPFYYGLSNEISQSVRKYCLICHNFKPERTHHCSHCKRCVLNMDHHCPWINNCVGFRNRKFFLLFLIYISLGLIFMSVIEIICMIGEIAKIIETKEAGFHFALKLIITLITVTLAFMLTFFGLYHLKMVCRNTTTLEEMTLKKGNIEDENGSFRFYDAGLSENMEQVFGENKLFWGIPIYGNGPKRNGTSWPVAGPRNVKLYEELAGNEERI